MWYRNSIALYYFYDGNQVVGKTNQALNIYALRKLELIDVVSRYNIKLYSIQRIMYDSFSRQNGKNIDFALLVPALCVLNSNPTMA